MIRRASAALLLALGLAGCGWFRRPPVLPPSPAHYVLGTAYQMGGVWYYPKDLTEYAESGLATIAPGKAGLTADGERDDSSALTASHHTLQLPAIARVTNLENGREVLVRLNDRGPVEPGRLIGLSRHAANLLGVADGTQIRVQLESGMSRELTDQVGGGPKLEVASAPLAAVNAVALPPPPGVGQSSRGRTVASRGPMAAAVGAGPLAMVPDRLPDQVVQGQPQPGLIYLRASEFSRIEYARRLAAELAGLHPDIERVRTGRSETFRVRAGPFPSVAAADMALDQARRAGVIDSHLVVE